jgi:hypothetical protein
MNYCIVQRTKLAMNALHHRKAFSFSKYFYQMLKNFFKFKNFITSLESEELVKRVNKKFRRIPYESRHFDNVITGYRECICSSWITNEDPFVKNIVDRMILKANETLGREFTFQPPHVLDLRDGNSGIGPHIDNLHASGDIIASLCLLSPCVLIFRIEGQEIGRVLVEPNTFYIQAYDLRYNCTHEIPMTDDTNHSIDDVFIPRNQRISIMIRDIPKFTKEFQKINK